MPLTPIHPVVPWVAYARRPSSFSFWALTIGSMSPDLEVITLWVLTGDLAGARGPMHSLLGALTIDAFVSVLAVALLVPPVVRWVDRMWPGTSALRFAGQDLRKDPRRLGIVYGSASLGALTHVLVDIPTHSYNPLLWPRADAFAMVPFADQLWYDVLTSAAWLVFLAAVLRAYWRR